MKKVVVPRLSIAVGAFAVLALLVTTRSGHAQLANFPSWIGELVLANADLTSMSDPVSSQEE